MREPQGKISVVMPSGKRMDLLNNVSEAIKANAEAAVALAKVVEKLQTPQVTITGCVINTNGSTGIHLSNEDDGLEQGVYHYSPTGYSKYDFGYPNSKKVKPGEEFPTCYGEERDLKKEQDSTVEEDRDEVENEQ